MSVGADLIAVGRIVKAFGIKGEVIVELMTDTPERIPQLKRVYLARWDNSQRRVEEPVTPTTVVKAHVEPRGARVTLAGITDRSAAERSVGLLLMVHGEDTPSLPDGKYYVHDLVGMKVISEAGEPLGTLADVLRLPAHDVYVVRDGSREWMVPAVSAFVQKVDAEARTVTVALIEGLRE